MPDQQPRASPATGATGAPTAPLAARLQQVLFKLQFLWFVGHLTTVIQSLLFIVYGFYRPEGKNYYKAYYGTLLSYGIILYKSYGVPQFNMNYVQRIVRDENTQYFMLALIWVSSAPISVTLVPYFVFSFLHILNYVRNEIIPNTLGTSSALGNTVAQRLGTFVNANHAKAINLVANHEVWVVMPFTILTIFMGQTSLFTPLVYAQFLSFRYAFSPVTKQVFRGVETKFDGWLANPRVPEWGRTGYRKVKELIVRYGDLETRARQQQAAQQAQAQAQAQGLPGAQ
ncbi:hypothetical protein BC831DRAFT_467988 [Entophlyctis helioformis]|nr:hypothetical protein BC831DRAFT_467988 [Entophlyctis helioformis]